MSSGYWQEEAETPQIPVFSKAGLIILIFLLLASSVNILAYKRRKKTVVSYQ